LAVICFRFILNSTMIRIKSSLKVLRKKSRKLRKKLNNRKLNW